MSVFLSPIALINSFEKVDTRTQQELHKTMACHSLRRRRLRSVFFFGLIGLPVSNDKGIP